jgi:hypothetical protein
MVAGPYKGVSRATEYVSSALAGTLNGLNKTIFYRNKSINNDC